jgi:uncharacterized delta-60 repeat protein
MMPATRFSRRTAFTLWGAFAIVIAVASIGTAAPGDLDSTFDRDGKVTADFGSATDWAYALAIQGDGRILVGGAAAGDFGLVRYNPDGSLDPTFDGDGRVRTGFGAYREDELRAVAIQSDGKIVAAGASAADFALVRYHLDGSLDTTFDADGMVTTDFFADSDRANDVVIQADGKIVAAGYSLFPRPSPSRNDYNFAIARYNTDGSPDMTFDGDGKLTTDFAGGNDDLARGVAVQPDGRIVAVGDATVAIGPSVATIDFALARYNVDASLDTTFGGDGMVTTDFSTESANSGDFAEAVAIQPDGKIVTGGKTLFSREGTVAADWEFVLARYAFDGSLDMDFDHDGWVTTPIGSGHALALQQDGKIVVAGSGNDDFVVARYNPNGSLDASFGGGDGTVTTDFTQESDWSVAVAIQNDGKIVAAGAAADDFGVARYTVCRRTSSRKSSMPCR